MATPDRDLPFYEYQIRTVLLKLPICYLDDLLYKNDEWLIAERKIAVS